VCRPKEETVIYGQLQGRITGYVTSATRMTLADGSSSVTVPPGWARILSTSSESGIFRFNIDAFQRKGAKQGVAILSSSFPGVNMQEALNALVDNKSKESNVTGSLAQRMAQMRAGMDATNPTGRGGLGDLNKQKKGKWGGMTAYFGKSGKDSTVIGAKGSKFYVFYDADGTKSALTIRNSFRAP
jgi:hypothetical protein